MRKVLISLVEVATRLLMVRPDADEIFALISDRLDSRDKIVPDQTSVRYLMDMGFSEEKVILALRIKRYSELFYFLSNEINSCLMNFP